MKFLKKAFMAVGVVVVLLLVVGLAGGGSKKSDSGSSSSSSSESQSQEQTSEDETKDAGKKEEQEASSKESDYTVNIDGASVGEDYSGNPCIFVTYTFTNVSGEKPTSFAVEYSADVYQNGVQCDTAFADTDGGGNYMTKIKAGSSTQVTLAYELQDTTSDVEVEVKELFSWDDEVIASQTFHIA